MGGDASKKRFDDLLSSPEGALLKQELDALRKGDKPAVQAARAGRRRVFGCRIGMDFQPAKDDRLHDCPTAMGAQVKFID